LFEVVYEGQCEEEHAAILSALVLIEQQELPVAEMRYKGIGEPAPQSLDARSEEMPK